MFWTAVSQIERGETTPSWGTVEKWCEACGVSVAVITPDKAAAVAALDELGDEDRALARRVLRGLPHLSQTFRDMLGLMLTQLEAEEAKRRTG